MINCTKSKLYKNFIFNQILKLNKTKILVFYWFYYIIILYYYKIKILYNLIKENYVLILDNS